MRASSVWNSFLMNNPAIALFLGVFRPHKSAGFSKVYSTHFVHFKTNAHVFPSKIALGFMQILTTVTSSKLLNKKKENVHGQFFSCNHNLGNCSIFNKK